MSLAALYSQSFSGFMMSDPLTALGLAANIVQFVDFSYKLVCESKAIYDSSTGSSADNVIIETVATDLNLLTSKLTARYATGAIPDPIGSLASQCRDIARELLGVLDKIKLKGPRKRWKSFVQALRSIWNKDEIEGLVRRIESLRSQIHIRLQSIMR